MSIDYENFVQRMGSFDHDVDAIFSENQLEVLLKDKGLFHATQNTMSHFGIPGMKWGIRRKTEAYSERAKRRLDKKTEKVITKEAKNAFSKFVKANNDVAINELNGSGPNSLNALNDKWAPKFKGVTDWSNSPRYKEYTQDYGKRFETALNSFAEKDPGHNVKLPNGSTLVQRYKVDGLSSPEFILDMT